MSYQLAGLRNTILGEAVVELVALRKEAWGGYSQVHTVRQHQAAQLISAGHYQTTPADAIAPYLSKRL